MTLKNLIPRKRGEEGLTMQRTENPFDIWRSQMDRLFDQALSTWPAGNQMAGHPFPDIDVADTEKEIHVTAELPGIDEKDLEVNVDESGLTLRGEKREEREEKKEGYYLSERSYGSFSRHIPLPEGLMMDKAAAKFRNGVLEIHIPKSPEAKSKRKALKIEVE